MEISRLEEPYVFELSDANGHSVLIDSSADLEGKNRGMTPMQLVLGALMGCLSIDIILVLKKQKFSPKTYHIRAQSSKKDGVPSQYEKIHLIISIDKEVDTHKIDRAVKLSLEKYCSVRACLKEEIEISYEIRPV